MRKLILLSLGLLLLYTQSFAQTRTITGRVTDEKDNGLINASVIVKGTNIGTTTSGDGSFTLSVPLNASALVISYIGLGDQEVNLTSSNTYNVSLSTTSKNKLDEVVVVAYGTQQRRKITGAVSRVSGNEIENIPMPSVDQMLQGKVAGLQSVAPSGQPGSFQEIRIRGIGSINSSSAPLFVIDGVPVNTGDFSGATNSSNLLAGLNPNDIESVSVLRKSGQNDHQSRWRSGYK